MHDSDANTHAHTITISVAFAKPVTVAITHTHSVSNPQSYAHSHTVARSRTDDASVASADEHAFPSGNGFVCSGARCRGHSFAPPSLWAYDGCGEGGLDGGSLIQGEDYVPDARTGVR